MNITDELTETDPALIAPAIARACSRCHDRKVKSLREKIQRLEARLCLSQADPRQHLSEPTGDFQNEIYLHQTVDQEDDVENIHTFADKVGNLVVGGLDTPWMQYVGSASGTTFSKILFHQIHALLLDGIVSQSFGSGEHGLRSDPLTTIQAGLPNRRTAEYLLARFVGRVHVYWPIIHLPSLRGWFTDAYTMPRELSNYQKCIIFLVLALGTHASKEDPLYKKLLDVNTPTEYLSAAFRYYEHVSDTPNLQILQILNLLTLCMTFSGDIRHNYSLWQISRYSMRIAIQLGCHRNNPRWRLSAGEVEMRNRAWWCTYAFERMIAVATGRILSIRNHAIDAPFPQITDDDKLTDAEAVISPTFNLKSVMPAVHLFRLRRIAGDILESVYIA
ncbi:hypothetical protein EYB25_002282 [Talaromyces marneffei]|nr:hypothetical protein EYB25_002282 [Talaromyces marneffei]